MERFADEIDLAQVRADQLTELAVAAIRKRSEIGEGREFCLDCGCRIPDQRLRHVHNATRCTSCQEQNEAINRRLS
jgi:phage/conjugal plasmid C-4 type zinc finger TraR family protein